MLYQELIAYKKPYRQLVICIIVVHMFRQPVDIHLIKVGGHQKL